MFPHFVALSQHSSSSQRVNEAMDTDADIVTSTTASRLTDFEQFDERPCDDLTLREEVDYDGDDGGGGSAAGQDDRQDWENLHQTNIRNHPESRDVLGPMPNAKQDLTRRNGGRLGCSHLLHFYAHHRCHKRARMTWKFSSQSVLVIVAYCGFWWVPPNCNAAF